MDESLKPRRGWWQKDFVEGKELQQSITDAIASGGPEKFWDALSKQVLTAEHFQSGETVRRLRTSIEGMVALKEKYTGNDAHLETLEQMLSVTKTLLHKSVRMQKTLKQEADRSSAEPMKNEIASLLPELWRWQIYNYIPEIKLEKMIESAERQYQAGFKNSYSRLRVRLEQVLKDVHTKLEDNDKNLGAWAEGTETSLPGAEHRKKNGVDVYETKDRWKWNNLGVPRLAKAYGNDIVRAYVTDLSKFDAASKEGKEVVEKQTLISLGGVDQTFVVKNDSRPIGFLSIEYVKPESGAQTPSDSAEGGEPRRSRIQRVAILRDIVVNEEWRNKGFGRRLYESAFKEDSFDGLLGYTRTPEAVKLRIETGKESGFRGFCGSMGLDESDFVGPDGDREVLQLQDMTTAYLEREGLLDEESENLPPGFVAIKRDSDDSAVFPIDLVDVSKLAHGPIRTQFEMMNKLQQEVIERTTREHPGKLPPSIALILSSVKNPETKRPARLSPIGEPRQSEPR